MLRDSDGRMIGNKASCACANAGRRGSFRLCPSSMLDRFDPTASDGTRARCGAMDRPKVTDARLLEIRIGGLVVPVTRVQYSDSVVVEAAQGTVIHEYASGTYEQEFAVNPRRKRRRRHRGK
jgi:hypothetical protein